MDQIPVSSIGQDSHRFDMEDLKPLVLGGMIIDHPYGLKANSDGDVLLHSVINAVSGLTGVNILGETADKLCFEENIKNSAVYLKEALKYLDNIILTHLSISIECKTPKLSVHIPAIRKNLSRLIGLSPDHIGITATSGEALTDFGRGKGISVFCILTGVKKTSYIDKSLV